VSEIVTEAVLRRLAGEWIAQGKLVAGPVAVKADKLLYASVSNADRLLFSGFLRPDNSIKEFVFPRHEKLYGYRLEGKEIRLEDALPSSREQVILAARPCDAAAFPVLDHVFNWDYKDEFYNSRRAATTIVTLACAEYDEFCFCTSVGLGPAAERGSDALLFSLGNARYEVRVLTDKGRKLFEGATESSSESGRPASGPAPRFSLEAVREFLNSHFEDPIWREQTLRCLGCGACAYTCPTCHCFDIADEGNARGGARVKNWDSCQFPLFTLHASGHNPRANQPSRQRQRILHKFQIYPEKFGEVLCTGCGNCTRNCPAGLGVQSVLDAVAEVAHV
jgi:ferredoxin